MDDGRWTIGYGELKTDEAAPNSELTRVSQPLTFNS